MEDRPEGELRGTEGDAKMSAGYLTAKKSPIVLEEPQASRQRRNSGSVATISF